MHPWMVSKQFGEIDGIEHEVLFNNNHKKRSLLAQSIQLQIRFNRVAYIFHGKIRCFQVN